MEVPKQCWWCNDASHIRILRKSQNLKYTTTLIIERNMVIRFNSAYKEMFLFCGKRNRSYAQYSVFVNHIESQFNFLSVYENLAWKWVNLWQNYVCKTVMVLLVQCTCPWYQGCQTMAWGPNWAHSAILLLNTNSMLELQACRQYTACVMLILRISECFIQSG